MSDEPRNAESFGPNVWLIDEMFREFKEHPESVSESWRDFFSDYRPPVGRAASSPSLEDEHSTEGRASQLGACSRAAAGGPMARRASRSHRSLAGG